MIIIIKVSQYGIMLFYPEPAAFFLLFFNIYETWQIVK